MDDPLEKNFVQQMRDALQKQLCEFETVQKKQQHDARIVADDGARKWRELKVSLERLVEEITDGFPEGMLSYPRSDNENEFTLMHELSKRTVQVTFNPASAVISYQGVSSKGTFRPCIGQHALEYAWEEETIPASVTRRVRRIAFGSDDEPPRTFSTNEMSEIIIRCIVVEPSREN